MVFGPHRQLCDRKVSNQCPTPEPNSDFREPIYTSAGVTFPCQRLQFTFETDTYIWFSIKGTPVSNTEFVAIIHDIHAAESQCDIGNAHLVVTKYSCLAADGLLQHAARVDGVELLLHYSEAETMGMPTDSEVINIEDIIDAQTLPREFEVSHCVQVPIGG
jgi:hypothetical protein